MVKRDDENLGEGNNKQPPIARDRLGDMIRRISDTQHQMRARSGPIYELARERSRIITAAWREAGSPVRPRGAYLGTSGTGKKLYGPPDRTTAEWQIWRQWLHKRTRLQRELGVGQWAKRNK